MNRIGAFLLFVIALSSVGCGSSGEETVNVPKSATEGGNVVNDPELKKQIMGANTGEQQGAPPSMPGR